MIGTIVFVLAFVGIGLTVVLVAMRSGRGPSTDHRPARGPQRFGNGVVAAVVVALGLGVPLLVVITNSDSHAKEGPGGVNLTSAQAHGRELFAKNCATCHTLSGSQSVGRVGPNLDQLNGGNLTQAFVLDAIKNGRARGMGNMPAGLLQGDDAKDVASYVSTVAGR